MLMKNNLFSLRSENVNMCVCVRECASIWHAMYVWVSEWMNDDGESEQTKINSICLHVKMCMSDCRKTVQKFHFSLCNMEWITD